jgi:hypothetical protein
MAQLLDSETIHTPAGDYEMRWLLDDAADQPFNDGFTLLKDGGRDRIDILEGDTGSTESLLVQEALDKHAYLSSSWGCSWGWQLRSGAAIVRYLTLKGKRGVTLVSESYRPEQPSTDRQERVTGVAWAPDDAADPAEYTRLQLAQWEAWAEGDTFGWQLFDPSEAIVDECWGFYGQYWDESPGSERSHTLREATDIARLDAENRAKAVNLVGAGFVGLI